MPAPHVPTARLRLAAPPLPTADPKDLSTWRTLLDALAHQLQATGNRLTWSGEFSVDPGGTNSTFAVNVGAFYGLTLTDLASGTFLPYFTAGATIGASKIEGGGNLANNSWYYVYAWSNAGSVDYEISLTAPSVSRVRKSGSDDEDLARVYLGCFRTGSAGAPLPVHAVRGRYLYRRSAIASVDGAFGANGLRAVPIATGVTARTDLDLKARVPPHARRAVLVAQVLLTSGSGSAAASTDLYDAADTTSPSQSVTALVAATGDKAQATGRCEVQLTSAQLCGYAIVSAVGTANGSVDVMGWEE